MVVQMTNGMKLDTFVFKNLFSSSEMTLVPSTTPNGFPDFSKDTKKMTLKSGDTLTIVKLRNLEVYFVHTSECSIAFDHDDMSMTEEGALKKLIEATKDLGISC